MLLPFNIYYYICVYHTHMFLGLYDINIEDTMLKWRRKIGINLISYYFTFWLHIGISSRGRLVQKNRHLLYCLCWSFLLFEFPWCLKKFTKTFFIRFLIIQYVYFENNHYFVTYYTTNIGLCKLFLDMFLLRFSLDVIDGG